MRLSDLAPGGVLFGDLGEVYLIDSRTEQVIGSEAAQRTVTLRLVLAGTVADHSLRPGGDPDAGGEVR